MPAILKRPASRRREKASKPAKRQEKAVDLVNRALDEGYRPGSRAFSAYIGSGGDKRAIREEVSGRDGRGRGVMARPSDLKRKQRREQR